MKPCIRCGLTLSIEEFHKHPRMADGHINKCKACVRSDCQKRYDVRNIRTRERRRTDAAFREAQRAYRAAYQAKPGKRARTRALERERYWQDVDVARAKRKAHRARHIDEIRIRDRIHSAEYRRTHPETAKLAVTRWCEANPERLRARKMAYRHSHPQSHNANNLRRQELEIKQSDGTLTLQVVAELYAQARECPYCGRNIRWKHKSLDHLEPLSKGGLHGISNVIFACISCNKRKHDKPLARWVGELAEPYRSRWLTMSGLATSVGAA